ncbi:MAG: transglutaminase family protein [Verrucomicrobiia bacterium]
MRRTNLHHTAARAYRFLREAGIELTLGGEPTFLPLEPEGLEWTVSAVGPTKLDYAYRFAQALMDQELQQAFAVLTPGKLYPGEVNPRWVLNVIQLHEGANPFPFSPTTKTALGETDLVALREEISAALTLHPSSWHPATDPTGSAENVAVLPLDWVSGAWRTERWPMDHISLIGAEGPAGLRLPLADLPEQAMRRALVVDHTGGFLNLFLPPLTQRPFLSLLRKLAGALSRAGIGAARLASYIPPDQSELWTRVGLAADPGVLEVNIPPCPSWETYAHWLRALDRAAATSGMCSFKRLSNGAVEGTGGGNHLLFGGPSLEHNPFFTRPGWVASMGRYFQHHPSLAFLFTGKFCGGASQAPRPDEAGIPIHELELAYSCLEALPPGDHRQLICETLRHLHADPSGSAHRTEICFDKFWTPTLPGGCSGLIEFRAIEALPDPAWNAAVAALWVAIAARTAKHPFRKRLVDWGLKLHDQYLLPSFLLADLQAVLRDLHAHGLDLRGDLWRRLWEWRFPLLLQTGEGLEIRAALEAWPLLSDLPTQGGGTSRFVDSSLSRIEISLPKSPRLGVTVNDRLVPLRATEGRRLVGGVRFRTSALFPCLHPSVAVQTPLKVTLIDLPSGTPLGEWQLTDPRRPLDPIPKSKPQRPRKRSLKPLRPHHPHLVTFDLRLA